MYKILITTTYAFYVTGGGGCACHSLVVEFPNLADAERAVALVNQSNRIVGAKQTAITLF